MGDGLSVGDDEGDGLGGAFRAREGPTGIVPLWRKKSFRLKRISPTDIVISRP